jgi:cytochrome c-type biogenesis protein CcmH/NrfG
MGDIDGAMEAYRESVRLDPEDTETLYGFGVLLNQQGQTAKARELWELAVSLDDGDFSDLAREALDALPLE